MGQDVHDMVVRWLRKYAFHDHSRSEWERDKTQYGDVVRRLWEYGFGDHMSTRQW